MALGGISKPATSTQLRIANGMRSDQSMYPGENNLQRPNFRQVGTKATGAVLRGAAALKHLPPAPNLKVSSIPSKFETVLHRDANERNGFGNRTLRFGENENELPGPGQYYQPPSLVRSTMDSGSVSRLGYSTGFVSKSKRFNHQVKLVVPGPGEYQATRVDCKPQNRKYGMSSFANTPKLSSNQSTTASVPGPADYNTEQTASAYAHNIAQSVFSSKTARGWDIPTDIPAPGQYENPIQIGQALRGKRSPQSVFKSTVKRLGSNATFTPGPGTYNAEDAESALRYDWVAKAHTSATFHTGNTDRFGHLPGKLATEGELGPGTYESPTMANNLPMKQGSVSVFKSRTSRTEGVTGKTQKGGVPGPAFYHPASPEKRSHLLNANKKWL